jgi:hypothetical protein
MHPTRSWSHLMAAGVLAVAAVTGISACSSSPPASNATTQASGQHMTTRDFSTAISKPGTVVLDVSPPPSTPAGTCRRPRI